PQHDPLPWRRSDVAAWTNRFTESALDALRRTRDALDLGHRFQIFEMYLCVAIQYHVRPQNAFRVGELLDPPHHAGGLRTPLRLDEWRHVETGTVLGLERAVVLADDEIDEFFHESRVPLSALWIAKVGDQREVKISVGCVAGDSGDETVLAEQFLEVLGSLREAFRRKAHVLGYERRALWTVFADESKESLAYVPRQLDSLRHASELHGMDQIGVGGKLHDLALQDLERSHILGAELHEKRRCLWIECSPIGRGLREGLAGGDESRRDHQFDRSGSETDEARDKTDRFVDCRDRYPGDAGYAGQRNG